MQVFSPHSTKPGFIATDAEELDAGRKGSDRFLLAIVIMLMMVGLMAVYSSIAYFAETKGSSAGSLLLGHMVKMGIAFMVMILFSKIDYHLLLKFSKIALLVSWALLLFVILFGTASFGAKRWISLGGFSFQPSSLATVALVLQVTTLVVKKQEYIHDFQRAFLPIMVWIFITCALIGVEDFSSAGLLFVITMLILFIGRVKILHIGGLVGLGILGGLLLIGQNPERQKRIDNYIEQVIHIKSDSFALDEGYQSQQAHIAFARGELFGVGIGKSSQRDFLPAPYNDFIFAIIGEEYGLAGGVFLMILFSLFLIRGIGVVARRAIDQQGLMLASAFTLTVSLFGFINAGVASGLLPVTGLPMPFVSYGGTNMLFAGLMVGVVLNVSKKKLNRA
ncbi:cell division protein FtsW [bacterium]|nr:MAG: cell division protein FtsW [bacterium]